MKPGSVNVFAPKRAAIGSFLGKLSNFTGPQLGGFDKHQFSVGSELKLHAQLPIKYVHQD